MGHMKNLLITIYGGGDDAVEAAKQIAGLSEIVPHDDEPRWIPVSERLPEPDTDVLVVVYPCWSERPYQEIGQWRSRSGLDGQGGGYWGGIPEDASPVTHWAPLLPVPEPPATATEQAKHAVEALLARGGQ
jgi:hypothetical protein